MYEDPQPQEPKEDTSNVDGTMNSMKTSNANIMMVMKDSSEPQAEHYSSTTQNIANSNMVTSKNY